MLKLLRTSMSPSAVKRLEASVIEDLEADRLDRAEKSIARLLRAQAHERLAALALAHIVEHGQLAPDRGLQLLEAVFAVHRHDSVVVAAVGEAVEGARDIDELNAPPPDSPLFADLIAVLQQMLPSVAGGADETALHTALAVTARMTARQHDDVAARSYRRLVELSPEVAHRHYNLGLFCKTRGLFREGLEANRRALQLDVRGSDACQWNLGICATGAGEGEVALDVWKRIGQKIEMGRFDLPEGRYRSCKVKLAERPLAERDAENDDPGLEETIWIERLSPCHGIVRSALYQDLGVDYGDVVLFDGAPITHHTYGDDRVPVFPHLATLVRQHYRSYPFAGTQQQAGELHGISTGLAEDAMIYPHSEQFVQLCEACWRSEEVDHAEHTDVDRHVVLGRVVAPPGLEPAELLHQIDAALADRPGCRIYCPDLCEAAGLAQRAEVEQRRVDMILSI